MIGQVFGGVFLFGALVCVAVEVYRLFSDQGYSVLALGELWISIHANSLVGFGAFVEQSISAPLWQDLFVPILSYIPVWFISGAIGSALAWFCRSKQRRIFSHR
jgi:hypothetical protein